MNTFVYFLFRYTVTAELMLYLMKHRTKDRDQYCFRMKLCTQQLTGIIMIIVPFRVQGRQIPETFCQRSQKEFSLFPTRWMEQRMQWLSVRTVILVQKIRGKQ